MTRAYLRLGLDPIASPLEVRRSYRSLSRTLHPDKVGEDEEKLKEVRMNDERSDEIKRDIAELQEFNRTMLLNAFSRSSPRLASLVRSSTR